MDLQDFFEGEYFHEFRSFVTVWPYMPVIHEKSLPRKTPTIIMIVLHQIFNCEGDHLYLVQFVDCVSQQTNQYSHFVCNINLYCPSYIKSIFTCKSVSNYIHQSDRTCKK